MGLLLPMCLVSVFSTTYEFTLEVHEALGSPTSPRLIFDMEQDCDTVPSADRTAVTDLAYSSVTFDCGDQQDFSPTSPMIECESAADIAPPTPPCARLAGGEQTHISTLPPSTVESGALDRTAVTGGAYSSFTVDCGDGQEYTPTSPMIECESFAHSAPPTPPCASLADGEKTHISTLPPWTAESGALDRTAVTGGAYSSVTFDCGDQQEYTPTSPMIECESFADSAPLAPPCASIAGGEQTHISILPPSTVESGALNTTGVSTKWDGTPLDSYVTVPCATADGQFALLLAG